MLDEEAQREDYEEAQEALAQDDLDTARACVKRMLKRNSEDPRTLEISGDFARIRGEYDKAEKLYRRMEAVTADPEFVALSYFSRGILAQEREQPEEAIPLFRKSAELFQASGDVERRLLSLGSLGEVLGVVGRYREAEAVYLEGLDVASKAESEPDDDTIASFEMQLGTNYRLLGELGKAERHLNAAAVRFRDLEEFEQLADTIDALGVIKQIQGDYDEAERLHLESMDLNESIEHIEGLSINYTNLYHLCTHRRDWDQAEEYLGLAFEIDTAQDRKDAIADYFVNLGTIQIERSQWDEAEENLLKGLKLQKKHGTKDGLAVAHCQLGFLYRKRVDYEAAEKMMHKALALAEEMSHGDILANVVHEFACLRSDQGRKTEARELWLRSLKLLEELGSARMIGEVREHLRKLDEG